LLIIIINIKVSHCLCDTTNTPKDKKTTKSPSVMKDEYSVDDTNDIFGILKGL